MTTVTLPPRRLRDPSPDVAPRHRPTAAPRADLRVVPDVPRHRRVRRLTRRTLLVAAVVTALAAPFALVLVHVELTANQLRLGTLQSRADTAQKQYEKLRLQVAQLESPARIVAQAQGLGMVTPTTIHYLTASPGADPGPNPTAGADTQTPGVDGWAAAKRADPGR